MKKISYFHSNKTHFHKKRFCTKPRLESNGFGTQKWPTCFAHEGKVRLIQYEEK